MADIFSDIYARSGSLDIAVFGQERSTFTELFDRVDAVADILGRHGVSRRVPVAVALPHSLANIVAILAIRRLGGTIVAVNYRAPASERDFIIGNTGSALLVAPRDLYSPETSNLQAIDEVLGASVYQTGKRSTLLDDDDALIIHTSGSTARPKGVVLTTGNLAANVAAVASSLRLSSSDRCALLTPPSFAYAFNQILTHLWVGGALLPWPHGVVDVASLLAALDQIGVSGLQANPSIFEMILAKPELDWPPMSAVRYVMSGGQPLYSKLVAQLEVRFPNASICSMYGLTENTPRVSFGWLPKPIPPRATPWPVGQPVIGTQVRIRTETGEIAATNEVGEIEVAGDSLMKGYLNSPTAEPSRFEGGWFKTRDSGYIDLNGDLNLTGRLDNIFSVGHEKVSPEEIEDVLSQIAGMTEVAVSSVPHKLLGAVPVVLYVSDAEKMEMQVRAACSRALSRAKFPRYVIRVDTLPRTLYGKLDRRALRQLADAVVPDGGRSDKAPET
jgi:acyl-CoA synthetase (AMP-forming)/AMP-acid ligase II